MKFEQDGVIFKIHGAMDEDIDLKPLQEAIVKAGNTSPDTPIIIDMDGLTRSNSVGIYSWLSMLKDTKVAAEYEKVPSWFIAQFNMNSEFLAGKITVNTFQAPFYSNSQDCVIDLLLEVEKDVPILEDYDDYSFPESLLEDGDLEPEFDAAEYFIFLTLLAGG